MFRSGNERVTSVFPSRVIEKVQDSGAMKRSLGSISEICNAAAAARFGYMTKAKMAYSRGGKANAGAWHRRGSRRNVTRQRYSGHTAARSLENRYPSGLATFESHVDSRNAF